jgi:hypothetical protein
MHTIQIDASPAQMRRLRKGHKVRVKKGCGFELLVHPSTYNIVSRSFNKGKGSEVQLSPEEIQMNTRGVSPEEHNPSLQGKGIMDDIIDAHPVAREIRKAVGRGVMDDIIDAHPVAREIRKAVGRGVMDDMVGDFRGLSNPMQFGSDMGHAFDQQYLDKIKNGSKRAFGQGVKKGGDIRDIASHVNLMNNLNEHLGTNYGYLSRAGMDNAIAGAKSNALSKMGIDARYASAPYSQVPLGMDGPIGRMVGGKLEKGTVGLGGSMISSYVPPALVSQPFSANFQFQHFLPPQYQHFNTGVGSIGTDVMGGSGLYV